MSDGDRRRSESGRVLHTILIDTISKSEDKTAWSEKITVSVIVRARISVRIGEIDAQRDNRCVGQELVWKRRVIYFLTVFASLYLVL